MRLADLTALAADSFLDVFGTLATTAEDGLGAGTIVLLGPAEPGFWTHVNDQPEFSDGLPDPLDRWSARVIGGVANAVGGTAHFPFGKPTHPFFSWALRSGRAWQSPVVLLVHDHAGLMVSYRGAILLPDTFFESPSVARPCDTCIAKPCLTACPALALNENGYDLDACHSFLDTPGGLGCLSHGCEVRRSCPVSKNYGRSRHQSAFHMERFHSCR